MSKKEKRPPWYRFLARANYDGSLKTYREIQSRILPKDEAMETDAQLPVQWTESPARWLLQSLGYSKKIPAGTGHGLIQSPYADIYTKIYGTMPISDLPKYRTIFRTQPDVQQAVEMQVSLAVGKGFTITHKDEKVVKFLEQVCNDIDLQQHMLVMASDMLVYGNSYTEILWDERKKTQEKIYEYKGADYTQGELVNFNIAKGAKPAYITGENGQNREFVAEKIIKEKDSKGILGLKSLDPIYMRVRRDSFGNQFGYIQWISFPPILIDNESMIHIKYRPKSTGYEAAYGVSVLMSLIKNNDLLNQFEADGATWIHSRAVPPLIVKGGSPEKPYSLASGEKVLVFNDNDLHLDSFENFAKFEGVTDEQNIIRPTRDIYVPSFNNKNEVILKRVKEIIKHKYSGDMYKIKTKYGKEIVTTSGHSLYKWKTNFKYPFMNGNRGKIVSTPIDDLKVGNHIVTSTKLPVIEKDKTKINILDLMEDKWNILVRYTDEEWIKYNLDKILSIPIGFNQFSVGDEKTNIYIKIKTLLKIKYPNKRRNNTKRIIKRIKKEKKMPYPVFEILKNSMNLPIGKITTVNKHPKKSESLPLEIEVTNDLLWVLGMFIAEGCNKPNSITFSSDGYNIDKIEKILDNIGFKSKKYEYRKVPHRTGRFGSCSPNIRTHSLILRKLIDNLGVKNKRIPPWVLQLPLSRSKWFLKGMYDGDGNHNSKNKKSFVYTTSKKELAEDLVYLLLRFGVISGVKSSETEFGTKCYCVYTGVESTDFESWDKIDVQIKNRRGSSYHLENEVALLKVKSIEKYPVIDEWVYDFSVEGTENFISSYGIMCHNSTDQMTSLMSLLKTRTAATMIFTKGDVFFEELKTIASDLNVSWWISYLLTRRYQALGVPPLFMGQADKGLSSAAADVMLHEFVTRIQILQEFISDPIEEYIFKPLIHANFGEDVENARIVWKPIIEEDKDMRSQRLIQLLQAGAISVNEARIEMGFDPVHEDKYDKLQPVEPAFNPKGFPPKEPSATQKVPKNTPESHMKLEDIRGRKIKLMQVEESFREKMLGLVGKTKFDLLDDAKLVKDIRKSAKSEAKDIINEHVVASYLTGRIKANAELGKDDDLSLTKEDLNQVAEMKENFVTDFDRIIKEMVKQKEDGILS